MIEHTELLNKLRAARVNKAPAAGTSARDHAIVDVGAPDHLSTGAKVVVPDTGEEGKVIGYARTHQITSASPGS
jgi:hypothetical protein